MNLGQIGGGLLLVGVTAVVAAAVADVGLIVPAALAGLGAGVVAVAAPPPLDGRVTRVGLGLLAVGGLSVAVMLAIQAATRHFPEMISLVPLLIAAAAIPLGCLAVGVPLARSSGAARVVGAAVLLGSGLVLVGQVAGGAQVGVSPVVAAGVAVAALGLAGVGRLAIGAIGAGSVGSR